MIRVINAELRKLRRPTLFLGTLGSVVGVTVLVTSLLYLLIDRPGGNAERGTFISREILSAANGLTIGFSASAGLLGIVALCVFAAQTAQEYTYGTLRNLLVRQPSRMKILIGKLLSMSIFQLAIVLVSGAVSIAVSFALAPHAKVSTDLWSSSAAITSVLHTTINVFISAIAYGLFGMALGLLLRSPISSISIGVLWLLIVEGILGTVWSTANKWLPGSQFSNVAQGGSAEISYSYSVAATTVYLVIISIAAASLFKKRDVSN